MRAPKQVIIGEDTSIDVRLISEMTKDPFDLTTATEIVAILANADGVTYMEQKLSTSGITMISAAGGHFTVLLPSSISSLLNPNPYADLELHITIGGLDTMVIIPQCLNIQPRSYPNAP